MLWPWLVGDRNQCMSVLKNDPSTSALQQATGVLGANLLKLELSRRAPNIKQGLCLGQSGKAS